MTMRKSLVLVVALGLCLILVPDHGKTSEVKEDQKKTDRFGLQALKERFEAAAPAIGERVPDLSIYTSSGEHVRFHDLVLGHYSVVVFGCLT
jgi:hypothetical protein